MALWLFYTALTFLTVIIETVFIPPQLQIHSLTDTVGFLEQMKLFQMSADLDFTVLFYNLLCFVAFLVYLLFYSYFIV